MLPTTSQGSAGAETGIVAELFHHDPGQARQKILELEARMMAAIGKGIVDDLPVRHSFIPGAVAREMTIPAGVLLIGHIHKYECFNFVSRGHITVLTEDGIKEIVAPAAFTSKPGLKRVGYAHADTVWTCVCVTDETNPERMIEVLTVSSYEEYEEFLAVQGKLTQAPAIPMLEVHASMADGSAGTD